MGKQVRHVFLDRIFDKVEQGDKYYFVSADFTGYFKFDEFRKTDLFVSVGIAEQNMVEVAAGLSLAGKKAICWSPAPFPVTRAFDQIRYAICSMNLPVLITDSSENMGHNGFSHANTEYFSLMRLLPSLEIINVTDSVVAEKLADYACVCGHPVYAHFDNACVDTLYTPEQVDFSVGFGVLRKGLDVALVSCGYDSVRCAAVADELAAEGIRVSVIDAFCWPLNERAFISALDGIENVITVEEMVKQGGLGSAVLEVFNDNGIAKKVTRFAVDYKGVYPNVHGDRDYWLREFGISNADIILKIKEIVKNG
jgi:transketolase